MYVTMYVSMYIVQQFLFIEGSIRSILTVLYHFWFMIELSTHTQRRIYCSISKYWLFLSLFNYRFSLKKVFSYKEDEARRFFLSCNVCSLIWVSPLFASTICFSRVDRCWVNFLGFLSRASRRQIEFRLFDASNASSIWTSALILLVWPRGSPRQTDGSCSMVTTKALKWWICKIW